ncbi:MAG: hypothetical protein WC852_07225 [Candidatus Nanoarchaeia archaeon]|jgi:hypothetical protein
MKKGEIEMSTIVATIAILAGLLIIGSIVWVAVGGITTEGLRKYGCWASNGFKSSNILFKMTLPSACEVFQTKEPVNEEQLAAMMKETWWMYGKGDWDYGSGDSERMVFYFSVDHDIDLDKYGAGEDFIYGYLPTHSDGMLTEKYTSSDYFYLTKNSEGGSICLGKYVHKDVEETGKRILEKVDERGRPKTYYIMFWDDAGILGQGKEYGDKIIIAGKPNLKEEGAYYCEVPLEPSQRLKIPYGGDRSYIVNQIARAVGLG